MEFISLYQFLKRNRQEAIIISFAALFLSLHRYHPIWENWLSTLLYYGILPVIVVLVLLRRNPLDFGLRFGNPRTWGPLVAVTCLVGAPILYFTSFSPEFQAYYTQARFNPGAYILQSMASLFASEFFFRGLLIFGLKEKMGEGSIFLQMVPFVLVHLGKPELETVSTILTGILFGYIAYRGNSFWPAYIIHLFINIFFLVAVNLW
jgi:membrane protease YdiL (CAAX protease family)